METLRFPTVAAAMRAVLTALRPYGHLPDPVVRRLKQDALALELDPLEYLQLALHQRYRQLAAEDRKRPRRHKGGSS